MAQTGVMRFMFFAELPFDSDHYPSQDLEETCEAMETEMQDALLDAGFIADANVYSVQSEAIDETPVTAEEANEQHALEDEADEDAQQALNEPNAGVAEDSEEGEIDPYVP